MRLSVLLVLLAPLACAGCFALDEIDKGSAELDRRAGRSASRPQEPGSGSGHGDGEERSARGAVSRWWEQARSLVPGEGDGDLVRCRLEREVRFMRSGDCRSLGGVVGG